MRSCLIVDESASAREALGSAVRAAGKGVSVVHEASDGATALRLLEEHGVDVVFLDMALAGVVSADAKPANDLGVLRKMLAARPDMPVVLVTEGSQPDIVDAISLGAVAALRRPVKADELQFVLETISPEKSRMDYFG